MSDTRDLQAPPSADASNPDALAVPVGRRVVMTIGIDQYRNWSRLANAVNDARGVTALFEELGFEELLPSLTNEAATGAALRKLVVTDLKRKLGQDDFLVLFFAGHGYTETALLQGTPVRVGYIIPIDGDTPGGDLDTWIELESWLRDVARLPARHILVILDSCHSGMALELERTRGASSDPYERLLARRSRRVITSAQDNQQALDSGPLPNHSLFTGLLIRGLHGDITTRDRVAVTGTELAIYLQRQVSEHRPGQTPDFGTLPLDAGGDMVLSIVGRASQARDGQSTRVRTDGSSALNPPRSRPKPRLPMMLATALCAAGLTGVLLKVTTRPVVPVTIDAGRDDHTDSGSSQGDVPGSAARPDTPGSSGAIGSGAKVFKSVAVKPAVEIYCYRRPTGGFQPGKPSCGASQSPQCTQPDIATRNNPGYSQLKCKQLCVCP